MFKKKSQQEISNMITLHEFNCKKGTNEICEVIVKNRLSLSDVKEIFERIVMGLEDSFYMGGHIGDDYNTMIEDRDE